MSCDLHDTRVSPSIYKPAWPLFIQDAREEFSMFHIMMNVTLY